MSRPVSAIVASFAVLASVSITTCAVPQPAGRDPFMVQQVSPEESVQTGFGEFARAGLPDNFPDWRRNAVSAGSRGRPVQAVFDEITGITVDAQPQGKAQNAAGQGALQVAIHYRNPRGMRQAWDKGPVTVSWALFAGDGSRQLSSNGPLITRGDAVLAVPGSTFIVPYPLPEQADPPSYGILQGEVRLPNGRNVDFREKVVRRSKWVP
ncbi:MAG: hypothetical protein H7338_13085 [Candidatus Sericytochromatia bacterium]|nr:hypothetical protein [Candidatus Sericytochromatia bacterium]